MPVTPTLTTPELLRLVEASRRVVAHLELTPTLLAVAEAAVELVGAAYGAVELRGPDGHADRVVRVGRGAAVGSLLEVPLPAGDRVVGRLLLSAPALDAFGAGDEALLAVLAPAAGVAIAHAQRFEAVVRRERWAVATSEITHELLTDDDALQTLVDRVHGLADATQVTLVLTHGAPAPYDGLVVDRASGDGAEGLRGARVGAGEHLLRRCLSSGRPARREPTDTETFRRRSGSTGPAMAVPLIDGTRLRGALLVVRAADADRFDALDLELAATLGGHAALGIDRADADVARSLSRTREDRDRIARDLHDHAIQRLYAVGLNLRSLGGAVGPGEEADRLELLVEEIDATIRQVRTTIFALGTGPGARTGLRSLVLDVVTATSVTLPEAPEVTFRGPLDLLVPPPMYADATAVVREGLSNVGRHARASHVQVVVAATPTQLCIVVQDDGRGPGRDRELSGLGNLRQRALARGGSFELAARDPAGSRLCWIVPLEDWAPD